jgi:hypothetical protein
MFPPISSSCSPKVSSAIRECVRRLPFKVLWLILSCSVLGSLGTLPVIGQGAPSVTTATPSHQAATAATPRRIVEREATGCVASGADYSIVWTFDGLKGKGKFPGTEQEMDIDSFDGHTLVVRRTSYSGGQIGSGQINLTAVYTGHINGTHITGTASYHPTVGNVSEGPWCGEIEDPRVFMPETLTAQQQLKSMPPQILECELDLDCDGFWSFDGSSGKAVWPRSPVYLADLTVESFSADKIVIRRNDTAPKPISVVYTGKLDGNRISGTAEAHDGPYNWPYNWTAIVPATSCIRTDGLKLDTQEAVDVGKIALRFNLLPAALGCYLIAANNGDAVAQSTVANMYKQGKGTGVDPLKSKYWSERAAATPEGRTQVEQSKMTNICLAKETRAAMQIVEDQSMSDPYGRLAAGIACGVTGVCASDLGTARILDSQTGNDGGKYTSQDPGSVACRGLFVHKGIKIGLAEDADAGSVLTRAQIEDILNHNASFIEWFKVKPLGNDQFRVTLLPTSIPLSKEYSQDFVYP